MNRVDYSSVDPRHGTDHPSSPFRFSLGATRHLQRSLRLFVPDTWVHHVEIRDSN